MWTNACSPAKTAQTWQIKADGTIASTYAANEVLDISNYGTTTGSKVWVYHPTGATNQQWKTETYGAGVRIVNPVSGLCLDAGTVTPRACDSGQPASDSPLCDATQPFSSRVQWLLSNLTQAEKIPLFTNGASGIPRMGIPPYQWWSEALHGQYHTRLFPEAPLQVDICGSPLTHLRNRTPTTRFNSRVQASPIPPVRILPGPSQPVQTRLSRPRALTRPYTSCPLPTKLQASPLAAPCPAPRRSPRCARPE